MIEKLRRLSLTAKTLIQTKLGENDFDAVGVLSQTGVRIKELTEQVEAVEHEVDRIEGSLEHWQLGDDDALSSTSSEPQELGDGLSSSGGRNAARKVRIDLDWSRAGKDWQSEVIAENTSSATMARFTKRLADAFGPVVLDKLLRLTVNRGPLLTKTPRPHFVNNATGELYAHKAIGDSGYYILTNNSTAEKVEIIDQMVRWLNLPRGLVSVHESGKKFGMH